MNTTDTASPSAAAHPHGVAARSSTEGKPPATPSGYFRWKACWERPTAAVLLAACLPVLVVLAALIRLTSRGPAIYRQVRLTRGGRRFVMFKLRTMRANAEAGTGPVWAVDRDPRITWIGRWLRDLNLDELPQLLNVVRGEMSLVGPRPERPEIAADLAPAVAGYLQRLAVNPGMTGLAQINLPADSDLNSVRRKLALDLDYIGGGSLWFDVRIMLATAPFLLALPGSVALRLLRLRRTPPDDGAGRRHPAVARIDAPATTATRTSSPLISVLVPVRNEAPHLAATLDGLVAQDYPPDLYEVLVIDGESTDDTRAIALNYAAAFPQVRVLANPRRLSSAARNIGVQAARGDLLVVVDGHCLVTTDYLAQVAGCFARSGADCLGRPQPLETDEPSPLQRAIGLARSSRLGHHPASYIYSSDEQFVPAESVAVAYRREVFERIGLFDEQFDACEDVELNRRIDQAGMTCWQSPNILVRYAPRGTVRGLYRQLARYGQGRVRLLRKDPGSLSIGSLLPAAFVAGVLIGAPLAFLHSWLAWAYCGVLGLYLATLAAFSWNLAVRNRSWSLAWRLPLVFGAVHVGAGWGALRELIAGRRIDRSPTPRLTPRSVALRTASAPAIEPPEEALAR